MKGTVPIHDKEYAAMLTSRGRITVPKPVRVRLGLKHGDRIEFVVQFGRTLVRRALQSTSPFSKYADTLRAFRGGKKEINDWLRELRGE